MLIDPMSVAMDGLIADREGERFARAMRRTDIAV